MVEIFISEYDAIFENKLCVKKQIQKNILENIKYRISDIDDDLIYYNKIYKMDNDFLTKNKIENLLLKRNVLEKDFFRYFYLLQE